ncbi:unnamed protein product [Orchesella dallaii]|uniref:Beta,beta-carotene 15,15'-monooxygenase n=1 Tax=Orchesella dallaii TaxID=48710 RepID=A0ABP1QV50_9HEXA
MPESETDLTKLFQSSEELDEPEISSILGTLPEWLKYGKFIRVGPGLFDLGNFTLNHWLDGYAIVSKFEIHGDKVSLHKKYLQSDAYKRAIAAQKPVITEFGTKAYPDPNKGLLSRLVSSIMPEMTDNDSSNIFKLGKDYFVCNDSCFFRKFDFDSNNLITGDKYDSQRLFGLNGLSAHPLTDENGDMYNIGFSALTGLKFSVIRIPSSDSGKSSKEMLKEAKVVCNIASSYGPGCVSYVHSFGMTSKYILFIEQPYVASISAIASALIKGHSVKDWLEWRPNLKNRFHLIHKDTGKLIKTEIISEEPFFFLHIVNCYVENDQMIVDVMALDDPGILDGMFLCKLRRNMIEDNAQPSGRRFVIPLGSTKEMPMNSNLVKLEGSRATALRTGSNCVTLSPDVFTEPGCEMPVINKKYIGKKHTYFYANGTIAKNTFRNSVCKINVSDRSCIFWRDNEYIFPGEPVFISNPDGRDEDDGVLIAAMSNVQKGENDILVFIDARSMKEVARASFRAHIPGALHGIFVES